MGKHILFILNPGFYDGEDGPYFCPHSAVLEGFIKYAPEIEEMVIVTRVDFQRPRKEIIDLIGEENQGSPVLVLDADSETPPEAQISTETGRAFINDEIVISKFLSRTFDLMKPH